MIAPESGPELGADRQSDAASWDSSRRLWSLWDVMNRFSVHELSESLWHLSQITQVASTSLSDKEVPQHIKFYTSVYIMKICELAEMSQMQETRDMAIRLVDGLNGQLPTTCSELLWKLDSLQSQIQNESQKRIFMAIDQADSGFFEKDRLFGDDVYTNFPTARDDIKESGNCLASGCATACIFHLMRVAEIGLRVLAWDRRVRFLKRPHILIENRQWEEILIELEKSEAEIQKYKNTSAREAQLAFYHGAMVELRAFKGLYRNRTAHAKEIYDIHQARSAMTHVSAFMRILATKISETKRTPEVWKRA